MTNDIQAKVNELVKLVRAQAPKDAVAFDLFINSSEYEAGYRYRDAKGLKRDCISMRALNGEFIR